MRQVDIPPYFRGNIFTATHSHHQYGQRTGNVYDGFTMVPTDRPCPERRAASLRCQHIGSVAEIGPAVLYHWGRSSC